MPERFCTMYEKCKFLSMGYISALTHTSMLIFNDEFNEINSAVSPLGF